MSRCFFNTCVAQCILVCTVVGRGSKSLYPWNICTVFPHIVFMVTIFFELVNCSQLKYLSQYFIFYLINWFFAVETIQGCKLYIGNHVSWQSPQPFNLQPRFQKSGYGKVVLQTRIFFSGWRKVVAQTKSPCLQNHFSRTTFLHFSRNVVAD